MQVGGRVFYPLVIVETGIDGPYLLDDVLTAVSYNKAGVKI